MFTGAGRFVIRIHSIAAKLIIKQHAHRWGVVVVELAIFGGPQISKQKTCGNYEADENEQKHDFHERKLCKRLQGPNRLVWQG